MYSQSYFKRLYIYEIFLFEIGQYFITAFTTVLQEFHNFVQ